MSILKVDTLQPATGSVVHAAGHIIQTQVHSWTTATTNTSSSFADVTGSSFSFTPKFATSDLILHSSVSYNVYSGSSYSYAGGIVRFNIDGSTPDYNGQAYEIYFEGNGLSAGMNAHNRVNKTIKIAASNTSAKTIKLECVKYANTTGIIISGGAYYTSTILVQEIAQ